MPFVGKPLQIKCKLDRNDSYGLIALALISDHALLHIIIILKLVPIIEHCFEVNGHKLSKCTEDLNATHIASR